MPPCQLSSTPIVMSSHCTSGWVARQLAWAWYWLVSFSCASAAVTWSLSPGGSLHENVPPNASMKISASRQLSYRSPIVAALAILVLSIRNA